ncbi:carbohydrate ABC transporter permease, partial [Schumannella luteola]
MAVSATNTSQDVLASRLLPGGELFANIAKLLDAQNVGAAMTSSFLIAAGTTVLALIICSIAGYGFEVYHSKGKDVLMGVLLLAMMIPFAATMIPLFQVFAKLGLVNSLFAVIVPAISTPLLILLFRQSSRAFPTEILEAARVDGLSEFSIYARIYVPTMRATFAAAGVITFMTAWNNYLWPRVILIKNEVQTMPMLIVNLSAGYVTDYGVLMLA